MRIKMRKARLKTVRCRTEILNNQIVIGTGIDVDKYVDIDIGIL